MIRRQSALLRSTVAAMLLSSAARAGVWGVDPVVGVTSDYATNPGLLEISHTAQADAALLIDAPITFNANDFKLAVLPSIRVGDTKSYTSVNSDYEHLTVKDEFDSERSVLIASGAATRDSSLDVNYLANGETGVRRDGANVGLNWDCFLSEKLEFNTDVNSSRAWYGGSPGASSLVDYKYTSITPTLGWNAAERTKFTVAASVGQYDSLDRTTRSRNANLQVGISRALTEIWSLTASGGFSRALNRIDTDEKFLVDTGNGLQVVTIPLHSESSQNGAVYSVDLTRKGERLTLDVVASRQEVPTGFAFLSRQSSIGLTVSYILSTRWSLYADGKYLSAEDPQQRGPSVGREVDYLDLSASWQWTEHWTLKLGASRITERYQSLHLDLASNQVAVTLSRNFNHIGFQ